MKFITILLLLFVNIFAVAQEEESINSFQGMFLFGGNATQIKGDLYRGFDKSGLHIGLGVNYSLTPLDKLQMEIIYSQKGSRFISSDDLESVLPFSYVDMPLLYMRQLSDKLSVQGGFSPNYLINTGDFFLDGVRDLSQEDAYKSFDLSGVLGLTYDITDRFLIDMRFSNSLLNIRKGNAKQYHNIITMRGGIKI